MVIQSKAEVPSFYQMKLFKLPGWDPPKKVIIMYDNMHYKLYFSFIMQNEYHFTVYPLYIY